MYKGYLPATQQSQKIEETIMSPPKKSTDFDRVYRSSFLHWMWSDIRIPSELNALFQRTTPQTALELGCGTGRFSAYLAKQGVHMTGVDFSPVAIEKARKRVRHHALPPLFLVADVTRIDALNGPFDVSFDIGCFHCLDSQGQTAYATEIARLLKPGGTHLIWAMDSAPGGIPLSPSIIETLFKPNFVLTEIQHKRRRLAPSHWYWLVRR